MENEAQLINKYQAEFENACDDLYYGYGYKFWRTHNNSIEDDNIAKIVWKAAFNKMSASESKTKNMKNTVKLNEGQLRKIVAESVKRILKEEGEGIEAMGSVPSEGYGKTVLRENSATNNIRNLVGEAKDALSYADDICNNEYGDSELAEYLNTIRYFLDKIVQVCDEQEPYIKEPMLSK